MKVCFYPPFKMGFMMQARLVWVSPSAPHLPKCRANKRCATPHPMRFSTLYPTTRAEEFDTSQGSRYKGLTSHQFRPNSQDIGIATLRKPNTTHLNNLKHRKHRRVLYTHTQSGDSSYQRSSLHVRKDGREGPTTTMRMYVPRQDNHYLKNSSKDVQITHAIVQQSQDKKYQVS